MVGIVGLHCPRLCKCLRLFRRLWHGFIILLVKSADARIPPAVAEGPAIIISSGSPISVAALVP